MHSRNPYLQPSLANSPAFNGYGAVPQHAPAFVPDPVVQGVMQGMQRMAAAVIQEIRNIYGIRLDRNEETAWLTYDTTPLVVPSGSNARGIMSVGQEADFVATGVVCQTQTSPATTPPTLAPLGLRFAIVDGSTNRQLQRANMPLSFLSVTGDAANPAGSRPYFFSKPRIFSRNSNVLWLLENVQGADVLSDIALFGYRIYDQDALDLTKAR